MDRIAYNYSVEKTSKFYNISMGGETENSLPLTAKCLFYYDGVPTFEQLKEYPPPEYLPILGIGAGVLICNAVVSVLAFRRQYKYLEGPTFLPAVRSLMILGAFALFAGTSLAGIISLRSSKFLHAVANVFEVFCILSFYENMVGHLRVNNYLDGAEKIVLSTAPCCCCLRTCLPVRPATEETVRRLRIGITVTIVAQLVLEFGRVMRVFECEYTSDKPAAAFFNTAIMISFLFAMWGLFVVYISGNLVLSKYNYTAKFVAFKLMILVSKFLYAVLSYIAKWSKGSIPSYYVDIGDKPVLVVKHKARISIWTNFVSILISTLLLTLTYKMYSPADYTPYIHAAKHKVGQERERSRDDSETESDHQNDIGNAYKEIKEKEDVTVV